MGAECHVFHATSGASTGASLSFRGFRGRETGPQRGPRPAAALADFFSGPPHCRRPLGDTRTCTGRPQRAPGKQFLRLAFRVFRLTFWSFLGYYHLGTKRVLIVGFNRAHRRIMTKLCTNFQSNRRILSMPAGSQAGVFNKKPLTMALYGTFSLVL